ncbi:FERM domain-containing protein 5 [Halotydeus destructor]|nr:FERM domain-containing protein 5 [Halotydeus destructor]
MFKFGSKKDVNTEFKCTIRLLDDNEVLQCDFNKEHKGQYLLDFCFKSLNLLEKDYFGLRYVDSRKQRNWLDPTRVIGKQVKGLSPIVFCFRVKFYPADPSRVKEEITRYFLYLQLRRDLLHGRLYCSSNDAASLMAYIIQSELGDCDSPDQAANYLSETKLIMNQNLKLERDAISVQKSELQGQTPAQAEFNFLKKACLLETYGIDPHPVKDHKGIQLYLGINYSGVITFQGSRKAQHFKWSEIQKLTYEGRMFIAHLRLNEKKHLVGFKCPTVSACHYLWRCAVEQRYFFTLKSSNDVPYETTGGGLFSRSCKLRYSGRVEREVLEEAKNIQRKEGATIRRTYSTTSAPPSMRTLGRSNTAPMRSHDADQEDESPERSMTGFRNKALPYLNSTTFSEPGDDAGHGHPNYSMPHLDPFDEEEWETSMASSLPTEFDMRPDLTPTGEETRLLSFEIPSVRESPSHGAARSTDGERGDEPKNESKANSFSKQTNLKANSRTKKSIHVYKLLAIVRTSILSTLLLTFLFLCLIIVVIESESDLFSHIRKLPEMVVMRREYYEPMKTYFLRSVFR